MVRTESQVKSELVEWETCLASIRTGQEYRIGTRWLTRADLKTVYGIVKDLRRELAAIARGGQLRVQRVVPRDS